MHFHAFSTSFLGRVGHLGEFTERPWQVQNRNAARNPFFDHYITAKQILEPSRMTRGGKSRWGTLFTTTNLQTSFALFDPPYYDQ